MANSPWANVFDPDGTTEILSKLPPIGHVLVPSDVLNVVATDPIVHVQFHDRYDPSLLSSIVPHQRYDVVLPPEGTNRAPAVLVCTAPAVPVVLKFVHDP